METVHLEGLVTVGLRLFRHAQFSLVSGSNHRFEKLWRRCKAGHGLPLEKSESGVQGSGDPLQVLEREPSQLLAFMTGAASEHTGSQLTPALSSPLQSYKPSLQCGGAF